MPLRRDSDGNDGPMRIVSLTVNGEPYSVRVPARTQLAELVRDHLHLTGTHLGCEHGVCGACTVLMDGNPVRSCITYAHACEGADVVTVEGLKDDPVGQALRDAFTTHHAVQCGFCTPGMLITARDIVTRLAPADEAVIRHELSGNLCRCTGYMGIVAAVREVAERSRGGASTDTVAGDAGNDGASSRLASPRPAVAFEPFEVDSACLALRDAAATAASGSGASGSMSREDGWSLIEREFGMEQPADALWALFDDLPKVAACLPGVSVTAVDGDRFTATAAIRFGPIGAAFDGEGTRETDVGSRTGTIFGRGRDSRGSATLDAELRYAMFGEEPVTDGPRTRVQLAIRFRIQGGLAQFNRSDLVESFADVVLADFVRNCERALAGEETEPGASGLALLWRIIRRKLGL